MEVLLDTHAFLWWCEDSPELSAKARKTIETSDCFVSMASFWEIAVKVSLGRLRLPAPIEQYLPEQMSLNGFETLDISFRHAMGTASLWTRGDPFDRMLAVQAVERKLPVVSREPSFAAHNVRRIW